MHGSRGVPRTPSNGGYLGARFKRILFPSKPIQGGCTIGFGNPFFRLSVLAFNIKKDLCVRVSKLKLRHGPFNRGQSLHVIYGCPVVCEESAKWKKDAEGHHHRGNPFTCHRTPPSPGVTRRTWPASRSSIADSAAIPIVYQTIFNANRILNCVYMDLIHRPQ